MKDNTMANRQRIDITLHPIELEKLDRIRKNKKYNETRSGMIARLIQEYNE
jgi:metal-responsive CopG/Arc/MetJ family transcriptional regulator